MITLRVPLDDTQYQQLMALLAQGIGANKADIMRKALKKYVEDQEVEAILRARRESRLVGDIDELAAALSD